MKLESLELRKIAIPRVSAFRTSRGTQSTHHTLLVRMRIDGVEGWGECVAENEPTYSPEYLGGAADVIERCLAPRLAEAEQLSPAQVAPLLADFRGHPMAKSALEMAVLDARLRALGISFGEYLGGVRTAVPSGVSVSIAENTDDLLDEVDGHVDAGYRRIKLKIQPGWDIEPVRAVRKRFGPELALQVDANTAYRPGDERHLAALDEFGLVLIEQPYEPEDFLGHAELARRIETPICLDESIVSAGTAATAISLGACSIINIKPGRVGGYLEARRIHDTALAHGVRVWCGGMAETGLGRAGNAALASLPGFTLANDLSASSRYYARDITEPRTVENGYMAVPQGPGLGVQVREDVLAEYTEWSKTLGD
ncbi:o-succinylbenzoate synthase [Sciscionella sediminilitoris]|uniref:o-succinylbenzoate synthase n=1 Tax=Sciscionella sediminilitoris TaxID=1445613 RepID=UPI0004DFAC75|nr:o-succinylbenzoate synthase [Sciscionella sp. SE31]